MRSEKELTEIFQNTKTVIGKEILANYGKAVFELYEDNLIDAEIALLNPENSNYENALKSFHIAQNLRSGLMN